MCLLIVESGHFKKKLILEQVGSLSDPTLTETFMSPNFFDNFLQNVFIQEGKETQV